jgi:hypothetical protein
MRTQFLTTEPVNYLKQYEERKATNRERDNLSSYLKSSIGQ